MSIIERAAELRIVLISYKDRAIKVTVKINSLLPLNALPLDEQIEIMLAVSDLTSVEFLLGKAAEKLDLLQPDIVPLPEGISRAEFVRFTAQMKELAVQTFGLDSSVVEPATIKDVERILEMIQSILTHAQNCIDGSIT